MKKKIENADVWYNKNVTIECDDYQEKEVSANSFYGGDYIELEVQSDILSMTKEEFETLYELMTELKKEIKK